MADMDNFSEINENFDTIKTLLNSIRAQGILNTSDVDKLLTGINSKLEKINTEEDIDLIKIFLSELKQNLDERHSILVSKFGAIESLFSNLLKNSSEMPKSAEIKELFDIVATNLSVFSREVVSQKESLTDITLRLDALRSDDSQKRDIIKNIALLKPDLERLNNGFDSIVISLNDNFKTLAKTISTIDKTEYLEKFSDALSSIEMSSSTVLSALQVLDKKAEQVDESLKTLATKEDLTSTTQRLFELTAHSHELSAAVTDLSERYVKIDNLAEKIDASVSIIAGLKAALEEAENEHTTAVLEQLRGLEAEVAVANSETRFQELKNAIQVLVVDLLTKLNTDAAENVSKNSENLKSVIQEGLQKLSELADANITRVLNDITHCSDSLTSKLAQAQSEIAVLCEKNFASVYENINDLKQVVSQIDENSVSANNAIFSSITDRLTVFENSLRTSLETQEKVVSHSSAQLIEQIDNIKNLSTVLDYKMDSSVVEIGNVKREFGDLKSAVDSVLALDFVNTVKDLRVDLYASKQELVNSFEATSTDLSDKITNDLYGKYELLISKLDSVEDEFKKAQASALANMKGVLEKISDSLIDVLSYVSETKTSSAEAIDSKIDSISNLLQENSMNYVESVRDVVDVIRVQVENNLKNIEEENLENFDLIKKSISENSEDLKKELKYSYSKLLEIQDSYKEIKDLLNVNSISSQNKLDSVITSTENVKSDFEVKLNSLKSILLDKITEFKQEFTCENADKVSELKFSVENLYNKNSQDVSALVEELRELVNKISVDNTADRAVAVDKVIENFAVLKDLMESLNEKSAENLAEKVDAILQDFTSVKAVLDKVDENIDGDLTRQLSIIESNFEALVSQITILFDKSDKTLSDKINDEFTTVSEKIQMILAEKLNAYRTTIEETFAGVEAKAVEQSKYLQDRIADLNSVLKTIWEEQAEDNGKQLEEIAESLRSIIDENIKLTAADYVSLKTKINEFAKSIESNNQSLTQELKAQLDDITKYIDSILDVQAQDIAARYDDLTEVVNANTEKVTNNVDEVKSLVDEQLKVANMTNSDLESLALIVNSNKEILTNLDTALSEQFESIKTLTAEVSAGELQTMGTYVDKLAAQIEAEKQQIQICKDLIIECLKNEFEIISNNVEKETDVIIAEIIEQFDLLKKSQADDVINLTTRMEEIVNAHIYNNIEDLKSYLDIKTDNSVLSSKLDNLKIVLSTSVESIISDLGKLLDSGVFTSAIGDFRVANEVLVNSAVDRLNSQIETFVSENCKELEDKLILFDKKFVDTVVDKFEEIKLISNTYNEAFNEIQQEFSAILSEFSGVKEYINAKIDSISNIVKDSIESTNKEISILTESFENLRSQISNKSFDEAFQASINKQIASLETLVNNQLGYIEDISELCANNLPDVTELNTLVKHSVLENVKILSEKIDNQNITADFEKELNSVKTEIITQFLNVFNQISFVAEQEEIIDFIQDKHDELITVLSHIVTTNAEISSARDELAVVDNKIDSLKDEIGLINEKITAIISADGDIDYVYSLQDLESDIANLRIVLNEMKENEHGQEFSNLISSTNDIYNLVESIKSELPTKRDFDSIAEDIVSISTRTNKLILASDESYKALHENLQDFKLVINDLDERTRNFAQESGMDRIDSKLNAINSLMLNGAKTNQVFNQVFEYLAEWVDNASNQINAISDRVETLDDIGQIKAMLADLKANSEDSSESVELIEALGAVFDKQTKRISSLETKLDKIIVDTTVNSKNNRLDLSQVEETLNKFLVVMDEKMSAQQAKIDSLELKLEDLSGLIGEKDTAQLTKKVGGMDRQIAKLNKSIEKIASHVVEK